VGVGTASAISSESAAVCKFAVPIRSSPSGRRTKQKTANTINVKIHILKFFEKDRALLLSAHDVVFCSLSFFCTEVTSWRSVYNSVYMTRLGLSLNILRISNKPSANLPMRLLLYTNGYGRIYQSIILG